MNKMNLENAYVIARVRNIHRNQLEELAFSEGRTKSSMIRCLIERAYKKHILSLKENNNDKVRPTDYISK